jgi:RimJ/RimL family protein N-acetyltransferase
MENSVEKCISFRNLSWDDRVFFHDWVKDEMVIKYSLSIFQTLRTNEKIDEWFHAILHEKNSFIRAVVYKKRFIGYAGISSINKVNNCGEYFIFIGDKQAWGMGIGSYVTHEIANFGFNNLLLNRISLTASDENIYALKAYKNAGFIEEGCMRQACYRNDRYHNKILMSIIKSDRGNDL